MSQPLLSICIPSYKKCEWLKATLTLIIKQVLPFKDCVEIVVSDDASPDDSARVLAELQAEYPEILRYEIQVENLKNNHNYVAVLRQARGQFVWLLGNDDFLRPGAIEKVLSVIRQYPDLNFIYTSYAFFDLEPHLLLGHELENIPFCENDFPISYYGHHVMEDSYLKGLKDIPAYDTLCFTPMYGGVVRHDLWLKAFEFNAEGGFFHQLQGSFGYAEYLVREAFNQPTYYIGYPYVAASRDITWRPFAASACLRNMPVLYDLLEQAGVDYKVLRFIRSLFLKSIRTSIPYVLEYRQIYYHDEFSFWDHTCRFWTYGQYWKNMIYVIPKILIYIFTFNYLNMVFKRCLPKFMCDFLIKIKKFFN